MRERTAGAMALVLLAFIAYGSALRSPFVFDDLEAIVSNESLRGGLRSALSPPDDTPVAARPLANLTFAMSYAIGGLDPLGFRLANLLIHVCAALVLWGVAARSPIRGSVAATMGSNPPTAAWAIAALWMLHPIQSEAVMYVTQRTELLAGLLYLTCLYCAIRALHGGRTQTAWSAAAIAACALGMGAKETMATAPLAVLAYDWVFAPQRIASARRIVLYAGLAFTWIFLLALQIGGPRTSSAGLALDESLSRYSLAQPVMLLRYLRTVFWPHPLAIDYGALGNIPPSVSIPSSLVIFGTTVAVLILLRRRRPSSFPGAWFFLTLAPSSSFVTIATEVGAERRMYLALAAPVTLVAVAYLRLLTAGWAQTSPNVAATDGLAGRRRRGKLVVGLTLTLVLVAEIAVTRLRTHDYSSAVSLWTTAVTATPDNARAYANLGRALINDGNDVEAERALLEAVRLDPTSAVAPYNLGVILLKRAERDHGVLPQALDHFERAAELQPGYAAAHNNAGIVLQRLGRGDDAVAAFTRGVALVPSDVNLRYNLATALRRAGRSDEAVAHYEALLAADPEHASAHNNLGVLLADSGAYERAIEHFERSRDLSPDAIGPQRNLIAALQALGRHADAARIAAEKPLAR